jgi:protein-disulfide isomerase
MISENKLDRPIGAHDHSLGPIDAPVQLVEYGDYTCPDTARARAVVETVLYALGDRVRFVFRNFPHTDLRSHAGRAAEAAESVAAHGGGGLLGHERHPAGEPGRARA